MRPLRAAVVGVGHLGRHHARILAELPGVELVVLAEPDEARGRELAGRYGCRWQPDRAGIEREVDFAVIAVPTVKHAECAGDLLRAGVSCLVEKPLAPDEAGCAELLAAAAAGGALLGTGHVERFNPAIRRAMELGIRPRFIEAHRLAPYTFRSTDVGVILDLMIHDLDLVLAWTGEEAEIVDAVGGTVLSPAEDICSARLRFPGGVVANLTASRLSLKPMRRFRVFGPDCYLAADSQERYALLVRKAAGFSPEAVAAAAAGPDPLAGFRSLLHSEELTLDDDEPLRAELTAFAAAVRTGGPAPVSGEDGARAVALARRIQAAMTNWDPAAADAATGS
ncbi:MAG: gfo/Idh/MocA family oxidoreductase, partial [Planctomycetota bacterium]